MELSNSEIDFEEIVSHVPVGVCKFLMDEAYALVYANEHFYDILGYTKEQMREELNNEATRVFLPEERDAVKQSLSRALAAGLKSFRVEHRVVRRDGRLVWVLVSGNFTLHGQEQSAHAVLVDITDRKRMEEQLRIDEERFRIALTQTDNSIFDYDIATKVMIHADKSAEAYGLSHETHNVPECMVKDKIVHPDSAGVYLEMYRQICAGRPTASCVIRAKANDGRYAWRKITMTNIYDQSGVPVRAVGMLEDIDEQTKRERRLLERSQRDPLTGVYNKGTTESEIRKLLKPRESAGALFIIDVDAFKSVNDHYGHLFGDLVLSECAHRISALCRSGDVIGRIGGDEFLVYLDSVFSADTALRKAQEICVAFEDKFCHNDICADIRCTVGLARCPSDGTTFAVLYQKADIALYEAKRNGRNRCCAYCEGIAETAQWVPYSNTNIDEPMSVVSVL